MLVEVDSLATRPEVDTDSLVDADSLATRFDVETDVLLANDAESDSLTDADVLVDV